MHHHRSHIRPLHAHDLGRRVHDLVHSHHPYHGSGSPFAAPHLRALLEVLESEGHDVVQFREELARLLRALVRARHSGFKFNGERTRP